MRPSATGDTKKTSKVSLFGSVRGAFNHRVEGPIPSALTKGIIGQRRFFGVAMRTLGTKLRNHINIDLQS
jgi:hypothetical protein